MLDGLHNRLWAEARRSVVLVLQGMDASGKDGTIRRVLTGLNPQGCSVVNFKEPTTRRPRPRLPLAHPRQHAGAGDPRGVEPVALRGRRHRPLHRRRSTSARRGAATARSAHFERMLTEEGITVVKVFLHISKEEQRARLQARIDDPEKNWKFRRSDLDTRAQWDEYQAQYEAAITATSTSWAPWYVVPADHKWVRDVAVATLLVDVLTALDPQIPEPEAGLEGLVVE